MPDPQVAARAQSLTQANARWQPRVTPLTTCPTTSCAAGSASSSTRPRSPPPWRRARRLRRIGGAVLRPCRRLAQPNARNHITPVKDQGGCGSCGSVLLPVLVEAMASMEHGAPLDLSEADLHVCSSHGANCGGWWPDQALGQIRSRGIPHEAAFPDAIAFEGPGGTPVCHTAPDRNARAVKITSFGPLVSAAERKHHLTTVGPCSAVLHVFNDFFFYGSGINQHVSGIEAGLHCVEVIGYSEADRCWICKNSWGPGWGDGGFFRIAYGECGIDGEFPFTSVPARCCPRITTGPAGCRSARRLPASSALHR